MAMDPDSKEFLLREYGELWGMCRDLYKMQNRAVGLYLAFLSALGAGIVKIAAEGTMTAVLCLPWTFWLVAFFFLAGVSATAQIVLARWWVLAVEYTTAINRIRSAFVEGDPTSLRRFVVLPTTPWRASGRMLERAGFQMYLFISSSASFVLGAALFRSLVRIVTAPSLSR